MKRKKTDEEDLMFGCMHNEGLDYEEHLVN